MNIRTLCLAILAHGEASGYDIKTVWAEGPFSHFVEASFGAIYPALARLEADGLVSCREEATAGKPSRKVYSITPAGYEAFVAAMSEVPAPDTYRSPFGVMALCAPYLSAQAVRRAMDARLADQRAQLEDLRTIRGACDHAPTQWVLDWGISHYENDIKFLEASRTALEELANTADVDSASLPLCPVGTRPPEAAE